MVEKHSRVLADRCEIHYTFLVTKYLLGFILLLFGSLAWAADNMDNHTMTVEQLLPLLGKPNVIIIDVRTKYDWDTSKVKIKGAVREESMKFGSWMKKYPKDKKIILYCA